MTPKQHVLKKYPKAYLYQWAGPTYVIYTPIGKGLSGNYTLNTSERTPRQAWAKAYQNIKRRRAPLEGKPWSHNPDWRR